MATPTKDPRVLKADQVKEIREGLGLSKLQAGKLLGGGPISFYKYESGEVRVTLAMSNLLRLLDNKRYRLHELREGMAVA